MNLVEKLAVRTALSVGLVVALSGMCHGRVVLPLESVASSHGLRVLSPHSFASPAGTFEFGENSRVFTFNGILVSLGFPTSTRRGKICLDESDVRYHLRPLLAPPRWGHGRPMVIAIDAGHGGEDDGAVSGTTGVAEKDLNLDLSLRVAKILERDGHRVVLTRKNDRKIPLEERTRIANRARADVFIAIHFNSSPNSSARGIETFTLTPQGQPSTYATAGNTVRKFPANDLDGLNTVLGYCLQSSLVSMVSATDRGVKHSHFTVLRGLRCPGALLECGFLSNAAESTVVTSSEYREKLARAIVAGIMQFAASTAR